MQYIVSWLDPCFPKIMENTASPIHVQASYKMKALVVDDSEGVRESLSVLLKRRGIRPVMAGNAGAAMERFLEEDFDLIVTDLDMPGTNGLALIRWIRIRRPFLPVIIVSGNPPGDMESVAALPATNFVREPFGVKNLDAALWAILRQFCG
jgi:DNA-binding response OmpR family regulator